MGKIVKGWCDTDPNKLVLRPTFGGYYLCANFGEIDQEMQP